MDDKLCPCMSKKSFELCCLPSLIGKQNAGTPEQLMRSRYSAFVTKNIDYLFNTQHPDSRESSLRFNLQKTVSQTQWLGLIVKNAVLPTPDQEEAFVEFLAFYQLKDEILQHHENSRFVKTEDRWFYLDGELLPPVILKNNSLCFCGSGKTFKKCHK